MCMYFVSRSERVLDLLELELQVAVSQHGGGGVCVCVLEAETKSSVGTARVLNH